MLCVPSIAMQSILMCFATWCMFLVACRGSRFGLSRMRSEINKKMQHPYRVGKVHLSVFKVVRTYRADLWYMRHERHHII